MPSRRTSVPPRRGTPPPAEFFDAPRPAAGPRVLRLDLEAVQVELAGLDDPLAGSLARRFGPFASIDPAPSQDALRVVLGREDLEYFLDPPAVPELNPVFLAVDADRVRYLGYKVAGSFAPQGGTGTVLLARGGYEPDARAIENFVRVVVAWRAAVLGGALVHAASAVRGGRGYLFYGESGAGKSTLAECTRRGTIVSDDLSLVAAGSDGLPRLVGTPFRGTWEGGEPVRGSFPLAAGFRLVQSAQPEVRTVPRLRALSELVGNLPFVAEAFARRPDLLASVERAFARVPLAHLHFRKDDTYWDAIDRAGL